MKKIFLCLVIISLTNSDYCSALEPDLKSQIEQIVKSQLKDENIQGAVIFTGKDSNDIFFDSFGLRMSVPYSQAMTKDTLFDIASLSKPVSTAVSILILFDKGKLNLDESVSKYIDRFGCNGKQGIKIKHLLSHTSGLPAYMDSEELRKNFGTPCPDKVIDKICSLNLSYLPGEKMEYSCLGYIILGKIVEIVSGKRLDVFANDNIFAPLGMKDTFYNPPVSLSNRIAATEVIDGKVNLGIVHDPLAKLMAGVSGNAGVFTTANDLAIFCRMLLNNGTIQGRQILSPRCVKLLTEQQCLGRAYGFDVSSGYSWIKGNCFSEKAFCHSGFTGTSIVCDPSTKVFVIILTNKVHPYNKGSIKQLRIKIADAACRSLCN
ncbi:MAG: serine hydrolase domain-containing protein [Phycisphaerales bacterium]